MTTTNYTHLTPRDLGILKMAFSFEGCSIDHIRRRFFPTPGARTSCFRRIAYLVQHGFLTSTRLPSLNGTGSGKAFLTIGPTSRPILAQMLGLSRSELVRSKADAPVFIAHHLALCDIRLAFEMATNHSDIFSLQDWIGDRELHQSPIRVKDPKTEKTIPLIPDSAFTLSLPDGTDQNFFLEMDMGTIAPKRMQIKLRAYLLRTGDPTPVLFVVPDHNRQVALAYWALEEARSLGVDPTLFWITTKDAVAEDTVLSSPIWQVVAGPEALALESLAVEPLQPLNGHVVARPQVLNLPGGLLS